MNKEQLDALLDHIDDRIQEELLRFNNALRARNVEASLNSRSYLYTLMGLQEEEGKFKRWRVKHGARVFYFVSRGDIEGRCVNLPEDWPEGTLVRVTEILEDE